MASAAAVQHKERAAHAYAAMENLGLSRQSTTTSLRKLLKLYGNEWDFIEAENYRALADDILDAMDNPAPPRGPVTRARRAQSSGSDVAEHSDDSPHSPAGGLDGPRPPFSIEAASLGTRARSDVSNSPSSAHPADSMPGTECHSGVIGRSCRAAGQNGVASQGGSPGTRGRVAGNSSGGAAAAAAAAAHEKEKGKSPLVGSNSRGTGSRRPPPPPRAEIGSAKQVVIGKLDIDPSVPAPEGFETLAFEKVDGVIIPSGRRPQNGGYASEKQARQLAPLTSRVKLEDEIRDEQHNPENNICSPAPLQVIDPSTFIAVRVKTEPRVGPSHHGPNKCQQEVSLDQGAEHEVASEMAAKTSPGHLQIVPYGTSNMVKGGPSSDQLSSITPGLSVDRSSEVELEEQGGVVPPADQLPENNQPPKGELEEDGQNALMSLVDYDSEDPAETVIQGTSGAGCDLVLIPDESSAEPLDPPELNGEEIRPNFILTGSSKRDVAEAEEVIHPKRQKCDAERSAPVSTVHAQRKLIISDSPGPDLVNEEGDSAPSEVKGGPSTAGLKRKLVLSASPSSEGSGGTCKDNCTANGIHTTGRCSEATASDARGQGTKNLVLKQVKCEPGVEDHIAPQPEVGLNEQQKHDPADISRGMEKIRIPFVNEFTSETVTDKFNYIASNVVYQDAYINISLARIGDEDCCLECTGDCLRAPHSCPCTRETGGEFAYTGKGLLKPKYIQYEMDMNQDLEFKTKCMTYCSWDCPIERAKNEMDPEKCKGHYIRKFVKECWHKCGCNMDCGNRVVQRGIMRKLQVFFTNDGKGWGMRTAEDLPAGAFICEYVGEIMTNMELDQRNNETEKDSRRQKGEQKDTYPVLLDGDWCSEKGLKDEEALCLDATKHGNVARFINHRCFDANLIDIPVSIEGLDRHYYHVAFFTNRDVQAGEELTWDYKIDFEDDEHPIEAFQCLCKSDFCRGQRTSTSKKHKK